MDTRNEHMELRYGDLNHQKPDDFVSVAVVSPPSKFTFVVQFLVDYDSGLNKDMVEAVRKELDFYLVEKGEHDPWQYCKYHCTTAANLYSKVHWLYFPRFEVNKQKKKS